ncbi:MAG: HlyD family efflux transporter periplasmic adaptor subunit [Novosphingobium sp.]|nr:HlyD family efflux transporter periplasmic adaptor subunit [Novosphingobium sp.]
MLFRTEVIEAGRQRLSGTVIAATPPSAKVYLQVILAVVGTIALLLMFGSYARSAQVRGVVAYDSGIARVYPSVAGEIRVIHVRPGQRVAAGTPLVTLALAQGVGGISPLMDQIASHDAELARQFELAGSIGAAEARTLEQQKASAQNLIGSLQRERALAQAQIGLADSGLRRAAKLASEGAGTQRQVEESQAALIARRAEVESVTERIIAQQETIRTIDTKLAQQSLQTVQNRSALAAQRADLAEHREQLSRSSALTLTASVSGEVSDVTGDIGQRAVPERSLVTIVPEGSRLEVWLYAPSAAVGFARPGQQVRLQFEAFPYQTYGVGRGTVLAVSRSTVEPSSLASDLAITEPVFRIRVRIDALPPRAPAAARSLRPGMTLNAALVQERRKLWELLFLPVGSALAR